MAECGYVRVFVLVWKAARESIGLLLGNWFLWEMSGLGECDMSHRAERILWPFGLKSQTALSWTMVGQLKI